MIVYEARVGSPKDLVDFSEAINIIRRRHLDTVGQISLNKSCSGKGSRTQ